MRRKRSSILSVSEEAEAFRQEAVALRSELSATRVVIADTMIELTAFTELIRDILHPVTP